MSRGKPAQALLTCKYISRLRARGGRFTPTNVIMYNIGKNMKLTRQWGTSTIFIDPFNVKYIEICTG